MTVARMKSSRASSATAKSGTAVRRAPHCASLHAGYGEMRRHASVPADSARKAHRRGDARCDRRRPVQGGRDGRISISGGETAQLKDVVTGFDLVGMAVGCVDLDKGIDGSAVRDGDVVIGVRSNGITATACRWRARHFSRTTATPSSAGSMSSPARSVRS
jgi:hypothetical protein